MMATTKKYLLLASALALGAGAPAGAEEHSRAPPVLPESTYSIAMPEERLREPELREILSQINEAITSVRTETQRQGSVIESLQSEVASDRESIASYGTGLASLEEAILGLRRDLSQVQQSLRQYQSRSDDRFTSLEEIDEIAATDILRVDQNLEALTGTLTGMARDLELVDESLNAQSQDVQRRFQDVSGEVEDIGLELEESYVSISTDIFKRSVIGATIIALLLLIGILAARRINRAGKTTTEEVKTSIGQLQEEQNKLDLKLSEFLTRQVLDGNNSAADQSFFLNVADEINRMRKRLVRMPSDIKGLKPLDKALERLESGLQAEGYEIVSLVGEEYVEGLNVTPRFIPDDTMDPGTQTITNIITPQVNYRGKIIQVAEVEVSIGS